MSWAVMQTELDPPTPEQLKSAFAQVPELTALDASNLGRDAIGVLSKGFDQEQATAMQTALAGLGVSTEVVDEKALTELPTPQKLARVEFTPEALKIDNLMGRIVPVEWQDILLIAAGRTRLIEFKTVMTEQLRVNVDGAIAGVTLAPGTQETQNEHLLLEVITRNAARRFNVVTDNPESGLVFQCLGERRTRLPTTNTCLLVQDLSRLAPRALLNHGAFFMREENDATYFYPGKGAFYREITWLLWMISTGRAGR